MSEPTSVSDCGDGERNDKEGGSNLSASAGEATVSCPANCRAVHGLDLSPGHVIKSVGNTELLQVNATTAEENVTTATLTGGTSDISSSQLCLVCGDKGSGFHYSVYSCEGCKGFFKRTVQKNLTYKCKADNNCPINRYSRNACQACRYDRCLVAGMKKDAVRDDRTPGGKHRNKRQRTDVVPAYEVEPYKNDLAQALVDAKPDLIPNAAGFGEAAMTDCELLNPSEVEITNLMSFGYTELKLIIRWARKVPGFVDLDINDQMNLLKGSFMELNVFRLSYRSMNHVNKVKFSNTILMSCEEASALGWGEDLISCTLNFVKRLQEVSIDHTEFCILNSLVLTFPDAPGIINKEAVTELQTTLLGSLRKYIAYHYPEERRRYGKMLLRLPSLRTISAKAAERFLSMTLAGKIQMTDLVVEMMS